jgi:hypothetical protein
MSFLEMFISALGGATVPAAVLGYLGKTFIEERRQKDFEDYKAVVAERAGIRTTVKKYSRAILLSAGDLQDRLWHLCEEIAPSDNKILLVNDDLATICDSWPMTKRHYLTSTMYLFARYFCWVEILKSRISLLEFNDDTETSAFNYHIKRVERMFAETGLHDFAKPKPSTDKPLFQLMQSEIGECLRDNSGGEDQCKPFHQFRVNYDDLIKSSEGLQQLEALLISSMSDDQSNFCLTRLKLVSNALMDMVTFLSEHNDISPPEKFERLVIGDFDNEKYLAKWPSEPGPSLRLTAFGSL